MHFVSYLGHRLKRLGLHGWQAKVCPSGRLAGVGGSLAGPLGRLAGSNVLAGGSNLFERNCGFERPF